VRTAEEPPGGPVRRDRDGAFEFEPHHCFACGELNEQGLHLAIHTDPQGSWTETTLDQRFQGWEAVAHGGIVCTLLDEVMAWAVIGRGTWGVTARLNVAFRRPIPVGRTIRAEGWVVDENRRAHRTGGQVLDVASGEILAMGGATFMAVPPDEVKRLKARYGMRRLDVDETADLTEREDTSKRRAAQRSPMERSATQRSATQRSATQRSATQRSVPR
jgi:acyl-coenzyme A thioesterase PaaI-like protein